MSGAPGSAPAASASRALPLSRALIPLAALPVASAIALERWITGSLPLAMLAGAGGLAYVGARFVRRYGLLGAWVAAIVVAILAGELSAVAFGGQSGRLLWADAVLAAGAFVALVGRRFRLEIPPVPFVMALIPWNAWCAVSMLFAGDPLTAVAELKEWMVAWAVAVAAACFAVDARGARMLLAVLAWTGALIGVLMLESAFRSPLGPALAVVMKTVDLPWGRTNYLAGLVILALPVTVGLLGSAKTHRSRLLWIVVLIANATGLALSASKGAVLALVAGLLIAYLPGGRSSRTASAVLLAVLALGAAAFLFGPLKQVLEYRLQASALQYSMGERLDLYVLAWDLFAKSPILGVGLNNFSVVSHRFHGLDTVPHNLELGFIAELGLPGMLLALLWVGTLGAAAWRCRRHGLGAAERALGLGAWAAFLGFLIHNQFESTIYGEQYKIMLAVFAAATWRLASSREAGVQPARPSRG